VGWIALVFVVACLAAALAEALRRRRRPPVSARFPCGPNIPTLRIPVRDVGSPPQRFVDLRSVPRDLLLRRSLTDVLSAILAPYPDPASIAWVLPKGTAEVLERLEHVEHAIVWPRFMALSPGARHAVYVDGARLSQETTRRVEACGVAVALAWPMVVVPEGRGARAFSGAEILATE
jgi:hypothetical protein